MASCLYVILLVIIQLIIYLDINPEHYKRAASAIRTSISKIATGGENNFTPELAVEVLTKLMNTMIVNIMSGQLHGNSIIYSLFYLLLL